MIKLVLMAYLYIVQRYYAWSLEKELERDMFYVLRYGDARAIAKWLDHFIELMEYVEIDQRNIIAMKEFRDNGGIERWILEREGIK